MRAEGLGHVVVCTHRKADQLVDLVTAAAHQHDENSRGGSQLAEHLDPVDAGQQDVQEDELGCHGSRSLECLLAGRRLGNLEALPLERCPQEAPHQRLVIDDEHPPIVHGTMVRPTGGRGEGK
jgi:hypothetical protein